MIEFSFRVTLRFPYDDPRDGEEDARAHDRWAAHVKETIEAEYAGVIVEVEAA